MEQKNPYEEKKEIEKELKLIEKRIRSEILTPEEIKALEKRRLELINEYFENLRRSMVEKTSPLKGGGVWCQRYKNPFLRREHDPICEEFEQR